MGDDGTDENESEEEKKNSLYDYKEVRGYEVEVPRCHPKGLLLQKGAQPSKLQSTSK